MGIDPKWLAELVTEDEYGQPEKWEFHFRRATAKAMLTFTKAQAAEVDAERVALLFEALHGVIASVRLNGEPCSIDDMPFDLYAEVLPMHPTFQGSEDAGP